MSETTLRSGPPPNADPARLEAVLERIGPEFVFVDPRQAPLYHRDALETGESRLALAILEDALRCALRHTHSALASQRQEAREALDWIRSPEHHHQLAFEPICQRFELDPDWIRAQVDRRLDPAAREGDARAA